MTTASKADVYAIASRQLPPLDLREWFDESNPRQPDHTHAFLEACLREGEQLDTEDRHILSEFIVSTEGRDYDAAFRRRYRFIRS